MVLIRGTVGDDRLIGTTGDDDLRGLDGRDRLSGLAGNDRLAGGAGDDVLLGGPGQDLLLGGTGWDQADYADAGAAVTVDLASGRASGGGGNDQLQAIEEARGSSFDDRLYGSEAANKIVGRDGNDRLYGRGGDDRLQGGDGDDILRGQADDDTLVGGAGTNRLDGGAGRDTADYRWAGLGVIVDLGTGGAGDGVDIIDTLIDIETVLGSGFADDLTGGAAADRLEGGGDDDTCAGGLGDDILVGGEDADSLSGGAGADRFVYREVQDSGGDFAQRDTLEDFDAGAGDRIVLRAIDARSDVADDQAFTFIGTATFSAAGQLRFEVSGGGLTLYASTDTDTFAEFSLRLEGVTTIDAGAFVL